MRKKPNDGRFLTSERMPIEKDGIWVLAQWRDQSKTLRPFSVRKPSQISEREVVAWWRLPEIYVPQTEE